jgi:adenylate cyclase
VANQKISAKIIWGFLIAFILAVLLSVLLVTGIFESTELATVDMRFQWRGTRDIAHSNLILIDIDYQTYKSCEERFPYPREYYATLIENLNEVGVRKIVFDIQFTEPDKKNPRGDRALADAIKAAGNVILSGTIARKITHGRDYRFLDPPLPILLESGCRWGVVSELNDVDGFVRRNQIFQPYQDRNIYSLGTQVLFSERNLPSAPEWYYRGGYFVFSDSSQRVVEKVRAHRENLGYEQTVLINYNGPRSTFPTYSMSSVLDDSNFDLKEDEDTDYLEIFKTHSSLSYELRIPILLGESQQIEAWSLLAAGDTTQVDHLLSRSNPFLGKIALIGASIEELHDNKFTPFYNYGGRRMLMPGIEVYANAIQTLLDRDYITDLPLEVDIAIIFLICLMTMFMSVLSRPLLGMLSAVMMAVSFTVICFWLFVQMNLLLKLAPGLIGVLSSYGASVVILFLSEQKDKKRIRGMFQTYMSPKILKYLEEHPSAFSLSGERRDSTIFFSDITTFTTISESLPADELATLLNRYLSPMTDVLLKYNGYIDKYEGDLIMAEFGVPVEDPEHAREACFAALEQQEHMRLLRPELKKTYGVDIWVRIGISSGEVSAGNMGSNQRFQYTVIGDTVNQAARLETANKGYGTGILISEETYKRARDFIEVRIIDKIVLKGKNIPIKVYELMGRRGELNDEQEKIREHFTNGIVLYWNREWETAIEQFSRAAAVHGSDRPSEVFIDRCEDFLITPPGPNWQGEFVMVDRYSILRP